MSLELIRRKAQDITVTLGRAAIHSLYPNDFEYYALSLELVDEEFNPLKIFHFPVMPNGISINRTSPLNIKKSGYGYFTQYSDVFQAYNISINGTFGRKFRLLINREDKDSKLKDFDLNIKTGYGATKVLEDILLESQQMNEKTTEGGKFSSHKFLFLYNLTFNQQFVVEVMNFSIQQSIENNMMWNYNIELKAVGDVTKIEGFDYKNKLKNLLINASLNKTVNNTFNNLTAGGIVELPKKALRTLQSNLKNGFVI